jgi:hypothetical protein
MSLSSTYTHDSPLYSFALSLFYWLQFTRLNAPKATLQTSAVAPAPSSPMVGIGGRMRTAEAVLLMAPGIALGAAVAAGLWLERAAVARGAVAWVCAAASCRWAGRRGGGGQQQQQQQQQRRQQLGTPLLGSAAAGEEEEGEGAAAVVAGAAGQKKNPKLVGNARGLRLAFTSHA